MSQQIPPAAHAVGHNADIRHRVTLRALDVVYRPRAPERRFARGEKIELYNIVGAILADQPVTYLEFGVNKGWSFTQLARRLRHPESRLVGFDSFEGLPEQWGEEMSRGHFSTGGVAPDFKDARAQFVKGWFQNSLPGFLASHPVSGTVLVHFDADLYSSTLFLLTTLWHFVPEYYFIFDEFMPDEIVAMHDFAVAYPVEYTFTACTQDEHERPLQILGKLRRIPLQLD